MNKTTKIWLILFALSQGITLTPTMIDFIPDPYNKVVIGIAGLAAYVFAFIGFSSPALFKDQPKKIDEV